MILSKSDVVPIVSLLDSVKLTTLTLFAEDAAIAASCAGIAAFFVDAAIAASCAVGAASMSITDRYIPPFKRMTKPAHANSAIASVTICLV